MKNLAKIKQREKVKSLEAIEKKNNAVTFEIVFVGRSNVGKSTLLNKLTGEHVRTGKRPGVTLKPTHLYYDDFLITDMPGFGFMAGVTEEKAEDVKTGIVEYIENHADRIQMAVQVIDGPAFEEIVGRWAERDEIPIDLELHHFLLELGITPIIAANKMDKIDEEERDAVLDQIAERFGYAPPWKNCGAAIAPVGARAGKIQPLVSHLKNELHKMKRDELFKYLKQ